MSAERLSDSQWAILVNRIQAERCLPVLGAGASHPHLPLGGQLAQELADQYNYPFSDTTDLARVSQYLTVTLGDPLRVKELVAGRVATAPPMGQEDREAPLQFLARLPIAAYATTNYDDYLLDALKSVKAPYLPKSPNRFILGGKEMQGNPSGPDPSVNAPTVYHLHGHYSDPDSLVLTEDDYIRFLTAANETSLPEYLYRRLSTDSLLFIGYSIYDWTFRVLINLARQSSEQRLSFAVMLPPNPKGDEHLARNYLDEYYKRIDNMPVHVYWGSAKDFARDLKNRLPRDLDLE